MAAAMTARSLKTTMTDGDNRDSFFNELFDDNSRQAGANREQRQISYESRLVRRVFSECRVPRVSMGQLVNHCKGATGNHELTFEWFNFTFPEFPARLMGRRIGYCALRKQADGTSVPLSLYQLQFADIFRPKNNLVLRSVSRALADYEQELTDPYVFIFPIVRKMFCAHNLELPGNPGIDEPRIQWIMQAQSGVRMTIEPTTSLFAAVGPDWFQPPE
jgi:hypothetical protein